MKKTILSWLLIGSSCAVFAQTGTGDTTLRNNTNNTYRTNSGTMGDTTRMNNTNGTMNNGSWNNGTMNNGSLNNGTMNNGTMNNGNTTGTGNWNNANGSLNSNTDYSAYGLNTVTVPSNVQLYFQRDYPTAGSNVTWVQSGDWYHGIYNNNGRYNHVYYNMGGSTYTVSLPIAQTWVPDDIINRASSMFGPMIYDVTTMKGTNNQPVYQVRVIENGQLRSQYVTDEGATVMSPFRVDTASEMSSGNYAAKDSSMMNMQNTNSGTMNATGTGTTTDMNTTTTTDMNTTTTSGSQITDMKIKSKDNKTKIKTKTADGKEQKTKIKDGQVITKED